MIIVVFLKNIFIGSMSISHDAEVSRFVSNTGAYTDHSRKFSASVEGAQSSCDSFSKVHIPHSWTSFLMGRFFFDLHHQHKTIKKILRYFIRSEVARPFSQTL